MLKWMQTITAKVIGIGIIALLMLIPLMQVHQLIATEPYALLIGALVLLVTVGLLMYLTRRIDWYDYAPVSPQSTPAVTMEQP